MSDHATMSQQGDEHSLNEITKTKRVDENEFSIEDELDADELEAQLTLELEMKKRQAEESVEARKQARIAKLANIERLKREIDDLHHSSINPTISRANLSEKSDVAPHRSLDFNTPFTKNMPDMYEAAIQRQPQRAARRRTMAVLEDEDLDEPELPIAIRIPMPANFDGSGLSSSSSDPAESVQVRLAHALDSIVDYIEYMCETKSFNASPQQFVRLACRFLTGTAAGVYKNLQMMAKQEADRHGKEVPRLVTWPDVRKALEDRFGRPMPGHQVITNMLKVKQRANESVEDYTVRFDSLHMELTRQNLASRDLSVALYIAGFVEPVKEKVEETVNSVDYFTREDIGVHEARKAITALQLVALARETHLARTRSSHTVSAASRPPKNHAASTVAQQPQSSNANKGPTTKIQVPDKLYTERLAAGLCGKCGSAAHASRECDQPRNLSPVPSNQLKAARANQMLVENQIENAKEPKN